MMIIIKIIWHIVFTSSPDIGTADALCSQVSLQLKAIINVFALVVSEHFNECKMVHWKFWKCKVYSHTTILTKIF